MQQVQASKGFNETARNKAFDELSEFPETSPFQVIYVKNDSQMNVQVVETQAISLRAIKTHLERGESIFLTRKNTRKLLLSNYAIRPMRTIVLP